MDVFLYIFWEKSRSHLLFFALLFFSFLNTQVEKCIRKHKQEEKEEIASCSVSGVGRGGHIRADQESNKSQQINISLCFSAYYIYLYSFFPPITDK